MLPVFPHKGFLTASRERTQGDSSLGAQHLAEGRSPEHLLLHLAGTASLPL